MWEIEFPETPKGEEELLVYYCQKSKGYVKITTKENLMTRYFWDGVSEGFTEVIFDRIIK